MANAELIDRDEDWSTADRPETFGGGGVSRSGGAGCAAPPNHSLQPGRSSTDVQCGPAEQSGVKMLPVVVYCTSEDEHFPITELGRAMPSTRGWQSQKHCTYPQQIGFRFDGEVFLEQLQLLSHEAKISSRIDVYVAYATEEERAHRVFPPYEQCAFAHLGYVATRNNTNNQFKSGEMRSCRIGARVLYVKLLLWEPHKHPLNFYDQVGLATIMCVGTSTIPFVPSATFPRQRTTIGGVRALVDPRGAAPPEFVPGAMTPLEMLQMDLAYDLVVVGKIREMVRMKEKAVQDENYELAHRLKEHIAALYPIGARIQSLEAQKQQATLEEEYETAAQLKAEIDEMRATVAAMRVGFHSHHHASVAPLPRRSVVAAASGSPRMMLAPGEIQQQQQQQESNGGSVRRSPMADRTGGKARVMESSSISPSRVPNIGQLPFDEVPAVASGGQNFVLDVDSDAAARGGMYLGKTSGASRNPLKSHRMLQYDQRVAAEVAKLAPGEGVPDDIGDSSAFVGVDKIMAALGVYATCCLFSGRHQLREAVMRVLTDHADDLLHHCSATDVVEAIMLYLGNPSFGIADKVTGCYFAACDMLAKVATAQFQGDCAEVLRHRHGEVVAALIPRLGDANARVRNAASNLLNKLMHASSVGVDRVCLAVMADKGKNFRLAAGKVDVVQDAILDVIKGEGTWERYETLRLPTLMEKMVEPALQHQHIQVREKGYDLMCLATQHYGRIAMEAHIANLKPSQRKIFDDRMGKLEKTGPEWPSWHEARERPPHKASPSVSPTRKRGVVQEAPLPSGGRRESGVSPREREEQTPPRPPSAAESQSSADGDRRPSLVRRKLAEARSADASFPPKPPRRTPPAAEPGKCQFCGLADGAFLEHKELVQHFMAECPMLCTCPLCRLPVEIREVHWHLAEDCEHRENVRQCPRCFEAVRADEFEDHLAEKKCLLFSEDSFFCPLCREKMPAGDAFWEIHILTPPFCHANPRTAS